MEQKKPKKQDEISQSSSSSNTSNNNHSETRERIISREIEEEMKKSYLNYAMSVIVGRALPDAKDGLKPVHRRVLYTMWETGLLHNKPYRKSANVVGNCMARFHPHGDTAIYDTLVRLAQNFSMRYTLVDGQGNWGSVDGDAAAAMRYCITGDSLILTDKGIIPIKEISRKKESKINMRILSYNGKKNPASKFFNSGEHNIIEIKTKLGYKIKGSYNHPLMCWVIKDGFPQIEWKLLENITKEDIVIINRNHSIFSKRSLNLKKYYPKKGFKNDVKLPQRMNNNLAFLLGALVSEGSFHNNQLLFCNKDEIFYNKIKSIILSEFNGIQLYENRIKGECAQLSIYEQKVVIFLKNIGLNQVKSDKKEIPFSILRSTKDNIENFLSGLFEGDGSVIYQTDKRHSGKNIQLNYDSKSLKLIEQLKIILLNFGVVTTSPYIDKRNGCYKLMISGYNSIKKFKDELNFYSDKKRNLLSKIDLMNPMRMSKTDFIPYINNYLRKKYKKEFILKNNFDRYNNLEKNYNKLIRIVDSGDKQLIDFILKQKYLFNEVSEILKLDEKKEVYSIKVDSKCHSFVANGFVNHNTECRLSKISEELLEDIDKETIKFVPNFDNSTQEPTVLPGKLPNLLINGSSGIAVGMATNIPPHNITEVIDGVVNLIDNPEISIDEIMHHVQGPDFPTGAIICNPQGIKEIYSSGRGKIIIRARHSFEETKNREKIIFSEIPYMVNKSQLIEEAANMVNSKKIQGVSDIRDESDKDGIRIVFELKQGFDKEVVLNQLYKHSRLQESFGVIMLALVDNEPKILNIKQMMQQYVTHRQTVVRNRTKFELKKAEEKAHILEGLLVALANIDKTIALIKKSKSPDEARKSLVANFKLSVEQAQAILDMKLQRLTSLEQDKIKTEHKELLKLIQELKSILASEKRIFDIIKKELLELKQKYADKRRTEIKHTEVGLETEDLIEEAENVITITKAGYIKRVHVDTYKQQRRGGKGIIAADTKEEDLIQNVFIANTHSYILFFTNKGRVYWLKVYNIPEASRQSMGKAVVNLLELDKEEKITAFIPIKEFDENHFLIMATRKGVIKKTTLNAYSNPRKGGIIAITLDKDDELVNAKLTDGKQNIIIATMDGMAVKFNEIKVRAIGRAGMGVRGVKLRDKDFVVGMETGSDNETLLTISENGYGKRSLISDYRLTNRGGTGVINIKTSDRNGRVVAVKSVTDEDELLLISQKGIMIRTPVKDISVIGRNTQGVRLMKLDENDKVVDAAKVVKENNNC